MVDDRYIVLNSLKMILLKNQKNLFEVLNKFRVKGLSRKCDFIYLTLIKTNKGKIITDWYRKLSILGRALNFLSNHPI